MNSDLRDCHFRVVIKFHEFGHASYASTRAQPAQFLGDDQTAFDQLKKLVPTKNVRRLLTTLSPKRIFELIRKGIKSDSIYCPPNFLNYYCVGCEREIEAKKIAELLKKQSDIEQRYIETYSACPPSVRRKSNPLSGHQEYLNAAPVGVNAKHAWKFRGGDGAGRIKFIDIEQGWLLDHEDLRVNRLPTTGLSHYEHEDHGAAVLGVIMMRDNSVGGIGITPRANGYVVSQWRPNGTFNTADAILAALDYLKFGDILLLEAQSFDLTSKKMWPVEIHDANFQAIRLATALGIIVIEAAGNDMNTSGNDLDDFVDRKQKIFNRSKACFKDSGAIMVAAACGRLSHSRTNSSNYGSRIDCFASGDNVVTAGLFPRSSGFSANKYTTDFCGTSSASAIITGVAIAVQSIIEAKHNFRISPKQMRSILSNKLYGTTSNEGHEKDKIGVMPDLKRIIDRVKFRYPTAHKEVTRKKSKRRIGKQKEKK